MSSAGNVLDGIVARTREDLERRRRARPLAEVERQAAARQDFRPFTAALERPGLSVIAEHKRRSPSAGAIREDLSLEDVVQAYERGGAAALSVLTESPSFGGRLDDLARAREASALPILRKDFIVDRYQLAEAVVAGADAVLLIVAALDVDELSRLHARAEEFGLAVLVEVHNRAELEVAASLGPRMLGINNRDLTTLTVDPRTTFELLPLMPDGVTVVAESGFSTRTEIDELAAAGIDAVLIGEALMRSQDLEVACRALTGGV